MLHKCSKPLAASLLITLTSCTGFTLQTTSCSVDECERTTRSNAGTFYSDPETGQSTSGATIYRLHDENEFRYPVDVDRSVLARISRDQAFSYLNAARAAAARPYHLCDYRPQDNAVAFPGEPQPIFMNQLEIIPAHGTVLDADNYVVFLYYSPGPLIFSNATCIAYRRLQSPGQRDPTIDTEMEAVTEALLSLGARLP